ncbi:MAG: glycosyltransferase family 9 protein [Aquificaceae bacterium]|nr:glycosyltransferase family 9 protein [Aquificaceae bacterium]
MRILLWQTAYLGDVVLTTPLIKSIRKSFPEAHIAFLGRPFIRELLEGFDIELITFNKSLKESLQLIERIRGFHVALCPHVSARSALILFLAGIPIRIGFDRSELSWLYTHRVQHLWSMHEAERNLQLLKPLGAKVWDRMPELLVSREEIEKVKEKFKLPENFLVLSPFSNFPLKEWHMGGWLELIDKLPLPPVVIGTNKDKERARIFADAGVKNLVGITSLRELISIISLSKAVISCDSAPVHIANAVNVPALSIYTATSPQYGFYPLKGYYITPNLSCSPCSPNPKRCRTGTQACLVNIGVEGVLEKLKLVLSL